MQECYHACLNCAVECENCATLCETNSEFMLSALDKCFHLCKSCITTCEVYQEDHHMECVAACRKCAEECANILALERAS